nr:hypothetical protein [Tanacetum cinerariifolium]
VVKRTGHVTRLQALVDKKKIEISKDAIREILQLDDAEGVSVVVPNSYNSSSKGQRFNFSREEDAKEEVQVSAHAHVDQENVIKEIDNDVAQPTLPLPSSPIVPPSPPHQSPRASSSQ